MNDSEQIKNGILESHIGKEVTAVLGEGQMSIFSGTLQKELIDGGSCWVLVSERAMARQGGTPVPVPETKIFFATEQLSHLVVRQETAEEALEKLQQEESSIIGNRGRILS